MLKGQKGLFENYFTLDYLNSPSAFNLYFYIHVHVYTLKVRKARDTFARGKNLRYRRRVPPISLFRRMSSRDLAVGRN